MLEKCFVSYLALNTLFETRCHITTQTKPILILIIALYTFSEEAEHKWLYWEARHSVTRIDKYTSAPFSNVECSANEVWMF